MDNIYEFESQTAMFGYQGDRLVGVFVIWPSTMTKQEIFEYFEDVPDLVLTVKIDCMPDMEDFLQMDEGECECEERIIPALETFVGELIERARDGELTDSECEYQISRTLH